MNDRVAHGLLEGSGYQLTPQRVAVIEILQTKQRALSGQEVYAEARRSKRSIGRTTVYRALALLTRLGRVQKTWDDRGEARYYLKQMADQERTAQLVCQNCGATIPLSEDSLERLQTDLERLGIRVSPDQELTLGCCPQCRNKEGQKC